MTRSRFTVVAATVAALSLASGLGPGSSASAQTLSDAQRNPGPPSLPPDVEIGPPTAEVGPAPLPGRGTLRALPRVEGTASPGLRVTLNGSDSTGGKLWYRWFQTAGPKVTLVGLDKAVANFAVPADAAEPLGFVLVVGTPAGVDARAVHVEIDNPAHLVEDSTLHADAGDDQSGRVGRRVTLNGVRSEPRGKLHYRWIQTAGPKVTLASTDGPTCSFVPPAAGAYRFALVVATPGGHLSEPSAVAVAVGGTARTAALSSGTSDAPADATPMALDELARVALASIEGGSTYAEDLSKIFDTVADRMDNFRSYTDAAAEMTRRLDVVVPRDKDRRAVWVDHLFAPVMARVAAGMRTEGLDLTQPEGQTKALSRAQRARLAEQFRFTAAGLRATRSLR